MNPLRTEEIPGICFYEFTLTRCALIKQEDYIVIVLPKRVTSIFTSGTTGRVREHQRPGDLNLVGEQRFWDVQAVFTQHQLASRLVIILVIGNCC